MYLNFGSVSVHISPFFAVFLALIANTVEGRIYLMSFVFVFIHELTHILFLFGNGCDNAYMDFYPGGIKLSSDGFSSLSYKKTVLCTLSAPCVNILLGFLLYAVGKKFGLSFFEECATVNFIMGVTNLLPLPFLDGGRTLNAFLCERAKDVEKANKVCDIATVLCLIFMFCGLFFLFFYGKTYTVFLFFTVYCTVGCINGKRKGQLT